MRVWFAFSFLCSVLPITVVTLAGLKMRVQHQATVGGSGMACPGTSDDLWRLFEQHGEYLANGKGRRLVLINCDLSEHKLNQLPKDMISFRQSQLVQVILSAQDLTNVDFSGAKLSIVEFNDASLGSARFEHAYINAVNYSDATLAGASFDNATILNSSFSRANLAEASFFGTSLDQMSEFEEADVSSLVYEPKEHPALLSFIKVRNLDRLTAVRDPKMLASLARLLTQGGLRNSARKVIAAIRRIDAPTWLEWIAFDWTCGYGANQGRLLIWLIGGTAFFGHVYWLVSLSPKYRSYLVNVRPTVNPGSSAVIVTSFRLWGVSLLLAILPIISIKLPFKNFDPQKLLSSFLPEGIEIRHRSACTLLVVCNILFNMFFVYLIYAYVLADPEVSSIPTVT